MTTLKTRIGIIVLSTTLFPLLAVAAQPGSDKGATTAPVQIDPDAASQVTITAPPAQPTPKVQLPQTRPADMKANIPGNVVNTAPKVDVPQGATTKVSPNIKPNLDTTNARGVEEANAARGLNDLKGGEALRNIPGAPTPGQDVNPDLGLGGHGGLTGPGGRNVDTSSLPGHDTGPGKGPAGSEYLPDLPSNQDKGPSSAGLRPSGDLRGIMGGANGMHKIIVPKTGISDGRVTRTELGDGGHVIVHTWRDAAGGSHQQSDIFNADGTSAVERTNINSDGSRTRWRAEFDEAGNATNLNEEARLPSGDPAGSPDPDNPGYSPEFARWASQFDHSAKKGAPVINQVNPGPDGATPNPQAPRLALPEDQLVINPSPDNTGGQARQISAEQAQALQDQLREKVKGPGGDPGTPEGPGQ